MPLRKKKQAEYVKEYDCYRDKETKAVIDIRKDGTYVYGFMRLLTLDEWRAEKDATK